MHGPHMLAKFSNNGRPDLYPTDRALSEAYAKMLNQELKACVRAGCEFIQFDEPAWTAFPEEAVWAAEVMNQASAGLVVKIGLHVCCGNAYRKRAYTTRYQDLADAFRTAKIDQACLEHCTLNYDMMSLWEMWDFKGEFAVGVIDQRSDAVESLDEIARRTRPALEPFPTRTAAAYVRVRIPARAARDHNARSCELLSPARLTSGRSPLCQRYSVPPKFLNRPMASV